jgi:Ulp1 family protease
LNTNGKRVIIDTELDSSTIEECNVLLDSLFIETIEELLLDKVDKLDLTSSEDCEVERILKKRGVAKKVLINKYNIPMTYENIQCLKPGEWLNDEVINFYLQMLEDRDTNKKKTYNYSDINCYLNTFVFQNYISKRGFTSIKRTIQKLKNSFIDSKEYIPIHIKNRNEGKHWRLGVVYNKQKKILVIDSLPRDCDCGVMFNVTLNQFKNKKQYYNNSISNRSSLRDSGVIRRSVNLNGTGE